MTKTDYLTTADVAKAKGVSVRTVARWVKAGRLSYAVKIPGVTGAYLFEPAVIAAFSPAEPSEATA